MVEINGRMVTAFPFGLELRFFFVDSMKFSNFQREGDFELWMLSVVADYTA